MNSTVRKQTVSKFEAISNEWWNPMGKCRPLHVTHVSRIKYIKAHARKRFSFSEENINTPLTGLNVLDVGCGGGLLSVPLARLGCVVTAIDPGPDSINVAKSYSQSQELDIDYRVSSIEDFAQDNDTLYDIITVMEVIEHVENMDLFLNKAVSMLKPGGLLFLSTLNRTWKSFMQAIVGAEYVMNVIPRGTHDWRLFRPPSEIMKAIGPKYEVVDIKGIGVNIEVTKSYLSDDISVNYIMCVSHI